MKKTASLLIAIIVLTALTIVPASNFTDAGGFWQSTNPAISGDIVVGVKGETGIMAFKLSDKSPVWPQPYQTVDRVYTSPTIYGDKVYQVLTLAEAPYRFLVCLELATGKEVWKARVEKAHYSRPMVYDDKIFLGTTGFNSGKGTVMCFSMDGKLVWEWIKGEGWIYGTPARLKIEKSDSKLDVILAGSIRGKVYPVDSTTGKDAKIWKNAFFETDGKGPNPTNPYNDGGPIECDTNLVKEGDNYYLYFGSLDGCVYKVDAFSGTKVWSFYDNNVRWCKSTPLVFNGKVFIGAQAVSDKGNGMYCLDAATGAKLEYFKTDDYVNSSPSAVQDSNIVFGTDNGIIYCLDQNLKEVWKTSVGGVTSCKPATTNDYVVVTSRNTATVGQETICLKASTGAKVW